MQSKSKKRWRIVTQEMKNCETSQEWSRNYYPRSEELQSKSRMEQEMLPGNCKIKKQVNGEMAYRCPRTEKLQSKSTNEEKRYPRTAKSENKSRT